MYRINIAGVNVVIANEDLDWALASLRHAGAIGDTVAAEYYPFGGKPGSVGPQRGEVGFSPYGMDFYAGTRTAPKGFLPPLVPGYYTKWFGTDYHFHPLENNQPERVELKVPDFGHVDLMERAAATVQAAMTEAAELQLPSREELLALRFRPFKGRAKKPTWQASEEIIVSWQLQLPVLETVTEITTEQVVFESGKTLSLEEAHYEAFTQSIRTADFSFATRNGPHGYYGQGGLENPLFSLLSESGGWKPATLDLPFRAIEIGSYYLDVVTLDHNRESWGGKLFIQGAGRRGWTNEPLFEREGAYRAGHEIFVPLPPE